MKNDKTLPNFAEKIWHFLDVYIKWEWYSSLTTKIERTVLESNFMKIEQLNKVCSTS